MVYAKSSVTQNLNFGLPPPIPYLWRVQALLTLRDCIEAREKILSGSSYKWYRSAHKYATIYEEDSGG